MIVGCLGALLETSGAIWLRFLAKLGRRWSQDGRKMGQVVNKLRPRGAMMAPRWPSWGQFGSFLGGPGTTCGHFFRDLWKNGRSVKTTNTPSPLVVFWGWGLLWRVLEAVLGGFWELCWKMLAPRWCFFGYLGRCCGILAPRWRTGAPKRGKIGELRRRGPLLGGRDPFRTTRGSPLHPPKNGFSRMGLQTPTPDSDSIWNWIWKSGRLEDWRTGKLEDWILCLRRACTRNCACGTVADICITRICTRINT